MLRQVVEVAASCYDGNEDGGGEYIILCALHSKNIVLFPLAEKIRVDDTILAMQRTVRNFEYLYSNKT